MATTTISPSPTTTVPVQDTTTVPVTIPATEPPAEHNNGGVQVMAVSTIPITGIPMTQAITEGYPGAKSAAQIAALPRAKITDFRANMKYDVATRIGVVNTGTAEVPVYEDRYEMKTVIIYGDIVSGSIEFYNAVMTGNAFSPGAAPTTTVPVTTTTIP